MSRRSVRMYKTAFFKLGYLKLEETCPILNALLKFLYHQKSFQMLYYLCGYFYKQNNL